MRRGSLSLIADSEDMPDQKVVSERKSQVIDFTIATKGLSTVKVRMVDYPEVRQVYDFDCGAASMRTILNFFGFDVREDKIMELAETGDEGTNPSGIVKVAKEYGLKYKIWKSSIKEVKSLIDKGIPVLVLLQAWSNDNIPDYSGWEDGHYCIVVGYDDNDHIYFEDPSSAIRVWMTEEEFEKRWHSYAEGDEKSDHFAMIFSGKEPTYRATNFVHFG